MPRTRLLAFVLLGIASIGTAQAEGFTATIGYEGVQPKSNNGVIAGADASIDDAWSYTGSFAYHFNDNWSADLWTGLDGFDHKVDLDGLGTVATLTHRPTALGVNYHFNADGKIRPYIGLGYNWVSVSDETGVGALAGVPLDVDSDSGLTYTAGVDFDVSENIFIRGSVRQFAFESDVFAGGAFAGTAEVDPTVWGVSVGIKF